MNIARTIKSLKLIAKDLDGVLEERNLERERYIGESLQGGDLFLTRAAKYGRTENGSPLHFSRQYMGYLRLLGDFRVQEVVTTGAAQTGKTLGHSLLIADGVCEGINVAWFYATKSALDRMVPIQFRPIIGYWLDGLGREIGRSFTVGRSTNGHFQVDGGNAIFSFVSTSKQTASREGKAAVGGSAASFRADLLILEERSQYGLGEADVVFDRQNNSLIASRPKRQLGTPGSGAGIEVEVNQCDYFFQPHHVCRSCGETIALDPLGCLLRKAKRANLQGEEIESYFSESGRPMDWWFANFDDRVGSAYIGCGNCGGEICLEDRLNAFFQCTLTGVTLEDFLGRDLEWKRKIYRVAIYLSPLCRDDLYVARSIVKAGLESHNTANWQQQSLGKPSAVESLRIGLAAIERTIGLLVPVGSSRVLRLCGIDVGRGEDWLVVIDYYLPMDVRGLSIAETIEKSVRHVLFAGDVMRSEIPDLLVGWGVEFGLIDNEPSRESAIDLSLLTCLQIADQVVGSIDCVRLKMVEDGGRSHPCWAIRHEKFMLAVFEAFAMRGWDGGWGVRSPESWRQWLGMGGERSPLVHLSNPWRDDAGCWRRGKNNLDDLYMAFMFAEAAFYLRVNDEFNGGGSSVGTYRIG